MAVAVRPSTSGSAAGPTVGAFVERHPVPIFYVLAFAISRGGGLVAVGGPAAFPSTPETFRASLPLLGLAVFAGPTAAGLLMTGVVGGRVGFRELRSRLVRWRVAPRWYAVALLTAPLA
jgi:CAAX protease family protein